jgi:hypothetical protein
MNDQYTGELAKDWFKMNELIIKLQQEERRLNEIVRQQKELLDKIYQYCEKANNRAILANEIQALYPKEYEDK